MRTILVLSTLAAAAASCTGPEDVACTTLYAYGLTINVTDETGAAVSDATVTITDGAYSEIAQPSGSGSYVGAGERAGNYTITVEKSGYQTGTATQAVQADECHVIGQSVDIQILP